MSNKRFDAVGVVLKPIVFVLCLLPLAFLVVNFLTDNLSANPISDITNETGVWTLRFLVITLAITPVRIVTGWSPLQRFRRMTGLFAFFYVCLHFLTYVYLDKFFDVQEMLKDIGKRPFITVGFSALLLLTPLAITSFDSVMRRMGGRRWKRLHRIVYVCACLGVIHYYWLVKADTHRPVIYGAIVATLLGFRAWSSLSGRMARNRREGSAPAFTTGQRTAGAHREPSQVTPETEA